MDRKHFEVDKNQQIEKLKWCHPYSVFFTCTSQWHYAQFRLTSPWCLTYWNEKFLYYIRKKKLTVLIKNSISVLSFIWSTHIGKKSFITTLGKIYSTKKKKKKKKYVRGTRWHCIDNTFFRSAFSCIYVGPKRPCVIEVLICHD